MDAMMTLDDDASTTNANADMASTSGPGLRSFLANLPSTQRENVLYASHLPLTPPRAPLARPEPLSRTLSTHSRAPSISSTASVTKRYFVPLLHVLPDTDIHEAAVCENVHRHVTVMDAVAAQHSHSASIIKDAAMAMEAQCAVVEDNIRRFDMPPVSPPTPPLSDSVNVISDTIEAVRSPPTPPLSDVMSVTSAIGDEWVVEIEEPVVDRVTSTGLRSAYDALFKRPLAEFKEKRTRSLRWSRSNSASACTTKRRALLPVLKFKESKAWLQDPQWKSMIAQEIGRWPLVRVGQFKRHLGDTSFGGWAEYVVELREDYIFFYTPSPIDAPKKRSAFRRAIAPSLKFPVAYVCLQEANVDIAYGTPWSFCLRIDTSAGERMILQSHAEASMLAWITDMRLGVK